jgi:hypothetical protein
MDLFFRTRRRAVVVVGTGIIALGVTGAVLAAAPAAQPAPAPASRSSAETASAQSTAPTPSAASSATAQPAPAQPPAGATPFAVPPAFAGHAGFAGIGVGMPMVGASQDVAKLLGLTPQELQTQLRSGKSLAAIAQEKGVSTDQLVTTILATPQSHLATQVKNGALTQQQADQMLQTIKTRITAMVQSSGGMGPGMMGGAFGLGQMGAGFGPGMMRGRAGAAPGASQTPAP